MFPFQALLASRNAMVRTKDRDRRLASGGGLWVLAGMGLVALLVATASSGQAATFVGVAPEGCHGSQTWTFAGSPYIVRSALDVGGDFCEGSTLTIEPGVVVMMGEAQTLQYSILDAVGTADQPIRFTGYTPGEELGDEVAEGPGWWGGLQGHAASGVDPALRSVRIENLTVEFAGFDGCVLGLSRVILHPPDCRSPPADALASGNVGLFVVKNCDVRRNGGVGISSQPSGAALIEGCSVHHNRGTGIFLRGDRSTVVRNSVRDNGGYGIFDFLGGHARLILVADNVLARNDIPLHIPADADIRDNTFDGNARDQIEVVPCGTGGAHCLAQVRWQRNLDQATGQLIVYHFPRITYHVEGGGGFDVADQSSLTIDPGNVLSFARDGSVMVVGALEARGTDELPILFTSDAQDPQPGDWDRLFFFSSASVVMRNVTIEYTGGGIVTDAPLDIADCAVRFGSGTGVQASVLTMHRCDIHHNAGSGLVVPGAIGAVDVQDSAFRDNAGIGVLTGTYFGHFERSAFARNALPIYMNPNTELAPSNTFDGNVLSEIKIAGDANGVVSERVWPHFTDASSGATVPYHVLPGGDGYLRVPASLAISPGSIVAFSSGMGLSASGALTAVGTGDQPILFTSDQPVKAPGQWAGITVGSGTHLENVTIEYVGAPPGSWGYGAAVAVVPGVLVLKNCVVEHNMYGLYLAGDFSNSDFRVEGCTIRDNGVGVIAAPGLAGVLRGNRIVDNGVGMIIGNCCGRVLRVDNNLFDNAINVIDPVGTYWNVEKTPAPGGNILGNPFFGGNAWSDYEGLDCTGDGLGDTLLPYRTEGNGEDHHPLVAVGLDTVPPVSTRDLAGPAGKHGWWRGAVTVTLDATDDWCGVEGIFYSVDDGAAQGYAGPFDIAGDGAHTVTYWAEDRAGNVEEAHTVAVLIDGTPPTVVLTDPMRGNVYLNDLGIPLVVRDACQATPAAPACAAAPFGALAKACRESLPAATCAALPFDGLLPLTVLVGTKTLGADAQDATSGVTIVKFWTEDRELGNDASAPYRASWDTTSEALARHDLWAVAEDAAGNVAVSVVERPITVPLAPAPLLAGALDLADDADLKVACQGTAGLVPFLAPACDALPGGPRGAWDAPEISAQPAAAIAGARGLQRRGEA